MILVPLRLKRLPRKTVTFRLIARFFSQSTSYEVSILRHENFMCKEKETSQVEGSNLPKHHPQTARNRTMLLLAIMVVIIILVVPIVNQNRIDVTISTDTIVDVSAQSVNVPLISTLFPQQSNQGTGVYTIVVQVSFQNDTIQEISSLSDVPIGQYTFILSNVTKGVPYVVAVQLIRNGATVDTFNILVTSF
jgi:hypothetical protein